ncbi:MAG: hypothetical protein ACRD1T_23595 [Acidimicrobiia bacterium]
MGSRLRHDLSDPLAMVAMIASALHEFNETLDPVKQEGLKAQIHAEITRAGGLASHNGIALELEDLKKAVNRFLEDSGDGDLNREVQAECARLIEIVGVRTGDGETSEANET